MNLNIKPFESRQARPVDQDPLELVVMDQKHLIKRPIGEE